MLWQCQSNPTCNSFKIIFISIAIPIRSRIFVCEFLLKKLYHFNFYYFFSLPIHLLPSYTIKNTLNGSSWLFRTYSGSIPGLFRAYSVIELALAQDLRCHRGGALSLQLASAQVGLPSPARKIVRPRLIKLDSIGNELNWTWAFCMRDSDFLSVPRSSLRGPKFWEKTDRRTITKQMDWQYVWLTSCSLECVHYLQFW